MSASADHSVPGRGTSSGYLPGLILLLLPLLFFCSGSEPRPQGNREIPVFVPQGPRQTRILSDARIHGMTGLSYFREGQYKKALTEYRTAITKLALIDNHIEIGRMRLNIALIHIRLKSWQEAEKSIALARSLFDGRNLPEDRARAEAIRGQYHEARQELEKALTAYRKALTLLQKERGDVREISIQMGNIGFILFKQKRYTDAITALGQAAALADRLRFYTHIPEYHTWLGKAHTALKDYNKALNWFYNALTADKAAENPSGIGHDLHNIGDVLFRMGKYKEASDYLSRAVSVHSALRKPARVIRDLEILVAVTEKLGDRKRLAELKEFLRRLKRTTRR